MTRKSTARSALVIIDMINTLDFPEGPQLLRHALPVARRIARLKARLKSTGVAAIYVNDNFTHWLDDFGELVAICSQPDAPGAPLAQALAPENDDYIILKPQHSAFYNTPLEVLLQQLGIGRVILGGIAGDHCILASAFDAHMRDLEVAVPRDCIASITPARNRNALAILRNLGIDTTPSTQVPG
ncbi:MAG TPA: isochorismatase family cysteine hydrolase [Luteimonas sp.]|nr:isochorismatase family cysteine hydrolase [Luteimonas sp.]